MQKLLEQIQNYHTKDNCLLATAAEGREAGEKVLFCGGVPVTEVRPGSVLERNLTLLGQRRVSGLVTVDGVRVFTEWFSGVSQLVVCGAGTVGQAVVKAVQGLGFRVTVLEDRAEYAERARELGADEVFQESFASGLERISGGKDHYFVVVTREHRYDVQCLKQIFAKPSAYVGMMGSRKRVALLKEQLIEEGCERSAVESLHAPIGLSIGAETPEEIAVSIAAELIQCRSREKRTEGYGPELLDRLSDQSDRQPRVLIQIVERKGSTPRGVGTKMVVFADGTHYGTIGGGWMEADVQKQAQELLHSEERIRLCREELASDGQQADNPMLCGGEQLILMEKWTYEEN